MRRIWQAVLSMGLSSVVTLLLSALRAKIVAVELGAAGVGILGIVMTTVVLASTALGGGLGGSGVRAVAAATEEDGRRDAVRAALTRGSLLLALVAAPLTAVAWWTWGDLLVPQVSATVLAPWVAVAVGATIGAAGNSALLNGLGRINALAASTSLGALAGTLVLVAAIRYSEQWGLVAAFAAAPVATLAVTAVMVRSTSPRGPGAPSRLWVPELRAMLVLGLAFSGSVILTNATQLVARVWVSRQLDIASAGYLQGCFAVGTVYLGFVLNALAAEYYPRISALHGDRTRLNRAVNDQMRIVLALATPVIVWTIVAAPWLLRLLYNPEFEVAHTLLRLLLVGDVFKLVGWCIGFLLLAREAKVRFFVAELSWNVVFLAVLVPAASRGLEAAGVAYATAYLLYAVVSLVLASRETGFALSRDSRRTVAWVSVGVIASFAAAESGSELSLALSVLTAAVCTVVAATRLLAWSRRGGASAP